MSLSGVLFLLNYHFFRLLKCYYCFAYSQIIDEFLFPPFIVHIIIATLLSFSIRRRTHNLLIHADTQLINSHNDGGDQNDHHNDIHLDKFTCFSFFFFVCSMRPEKTMFHFLRILYIFMDILIVSHFGDIHFNSLHTNHLINTIKCLFVYL